MTIFAGADNGKSASIVFIDDTSTHIIDVVPYNPKTLYSTFEKYKPTYTSLEEVFMGPGFTSVAHVGFEVLGRYKQVLEMLNLEYETVLARSWRKYIGIKAKGRDECKKAAINLCSELFIEEDYKKLWSTRNIINKETHHKESVEYPDDNKCESSLIALYSIKKYGELKNE